MIAQTLLHAFGRLSHCEGANGTGPALERVRGINANLQRFALPGDHGSETVALSLEQAEQLSGESGIAKGCLFEMLRIERRRMGCAA